MSKEDAKKISKRIKLSSILAVASIVLLFAGFVTPPLGIIDGSVIMAVGEIAGIIALLVAADAVERGIDAKIKHKDTEVELNNPDKPR